MKNETQSFTKVNNSNNGNSLQGVKQANLSFDKIPAATMRTYNDMDLRAFRPQSSLQQQSIQQVTQDFQIFKQDRQKHHLSEQELHHVKRPQSTAVQKQQSSIGQLPQQPSHRPPSNALKSLKFLTATTKINQISIHRNNNTERHQQRQQQQQLLLLEAPHSIHSFNKPSIQTERTLEGDRKSLQITNHHFRENNLSEERWRQAENYNATLTATIKDEELGALRGKRLSGNKKKEFESHKALLREKAAVLREEIKRKKDAPLEIKADKQFRHEKEENLRNLIEILLLSCRVESAYPEEIEFVIRNIEKECYFDWRTQIPGELRESILALDINKKIRNMLCRVNPGQHQSLDRIVNLLFEELLRFDQSSLSQKELFLHEIKKAHEEARQSEEMMEQMKLQMIELQEQATELQKELQNEKNIEDIQTRTSINLDKKYADQHAKIERLSLRITDLTEENNILKGQHASQIQTIKEFRADNQGLQNEIVRLNECILENEVETQNRKEFISKEKKMLQVDLGHFQDKIEEYCDNVNLKAGEILRDPNNYYAKFIRENSQNFQIGGNKEFRLTREMMVSKEKQTENNSLRMNKNDIKASKSLESNTHNEKSILNSSGSSWDDEVSNNCQNQLMNKTGGEIVQQATNKSINSKKITTGEVKKQISYQNPSWLREDC